MERAVVWGLHFAGRLIFNPPDPPFLSPTALVLRGTSGTKKGGERAVG